MLRHTLLYIFVGLWTVLHSYGQSAYREIVTQGLLFQIQADSVQRLVEAHALTLSTASESQKAGLKIALRDEEAQAAALQKKADEWLAQVVAFEGEAPPVNTISLAETEAIIESKEAVEVSENVETKNTAQSAFAILPKSPYSAANPIPVDEPLPAGVAYKIQLGAFSKPVSTNLFKGLTPVSGEKLNNGVTKYYVGLFLRFTDADDALRKVRAYGFKDAYIVAFYNRKTIHLERAKQLEK